MLEVAKERREAAKISNTKFLVTSEDTVSSYEHEVIRMKIIRELKTSGNHYKQSSLAEISK